MKTKSYLSAAAVLAIAAFSSTLTAQTEASPNRTAADRNAASTTTTTPVDRDATAADRSPNATSSDRNATMRADTRQSGLANANTRNNRLSRADRNFFEEAAKSGMKEVEVSNAVKSRLTNPQVRAFAEMMVADHSGANTELQTLAAAKGVTLPADRKDHGEKWMKKDTKDNELDKDYVETMEDDHEEAVELFEKASKSDDAEIAAFARKTLPKLQQHLDQIRTLKDGIK
jgi:putative membrane protein